MENRDKIVTLDKQKPQLIDLFNPELERKAITEGQVYLRKIEPINGAEQVTSKQKVKTVLPDGTLESEVEASSGDWIITGLKGEKFVVNNEKFRNLYHKDLGKTDEYIPKKCKVVAIHNPYGQSIRIVAPWSTVEKQEYQDGSEKSILVFSMDENNQFTNDRYIIGDEEILQNNYKKSLEQFRHIEGYDEAVVRNGSQEELEHLFSIVNNPEKHSREEFINAIAQNYSGEVYGDEHFEKEYSQWGGSDDGKLITSAYGEFRKKYPNLVQLSLDPGFLNHLQEFLDIANKGFINTDSNYKEVREAFKEKLGYKEVYRGMTLSTEEAVAMKSEGIISSTGRYIKTSKNSTQDEFEAKILSVRIREALEHHFYGGADSSVLISVSGKEDTAVALGKAFGKRGEGDRRTYLVKSRIPAIELIYEEQGHKVDKHIESFVFWKINPEEILEIKEVVGE